MTQKFRVDQKKVNEVFERVINGTKGWTTETYIEKFEKNLNPLEKYSVKLELAKNWALYDESKVEKGADQSEDLPTQGAISPSDVELWV